MSTLACGGLRTWVARKWPSGDLVFASRLVFARVQPFSLASPSMKIFFYGNCQIRQIYRIFDFLLEPSRHTLIFINDIDQLDERDLPLISTCLQQCDLFITTYVPDFKSDEFRTPGHLRLAERAIIVPNIYFFGVKPNLGELVYPDGSRGYEDIWIYKLLMNLRSTSDDASIDLVKISQVLAKRIYLSEKGSSAIPLSFSTLCLESSFEQIKQREDEIIESCAFSANVHMISIAGHLRKYIDIGIDPKFYTTDHPSLRFLVDISMEIINHAGLTPCAERSKLLKENVGMQINTTSTDFLYFSAPYQYMIDIGINEPDLKSFITYKPRFSLQPPVDVSLEEYVCQLYARILGSSSEIIDKNSSKLAKYHEMRRLLDLRSIVDFG